jgi:hypothetical protein
MTTVSIIGTAGRKDDKDRWDPLTYRAMYEHAENFISPLEDVTLVSGGAALADHVAVQLYLNDKAEHLVLHLPAPFRNTEFTNITGSHNDHGKIANYYHSLFSKKLGYSSLKQIQAAIEKGAEIHVHAGFFARNAEVAKSDMLIAYTYGSHNGTEKNSKTAGLKDGGTAHTWNLSDSYKVHMSIPGLE